MTDKASKDKRVEVKLTQFIIGIVLIAAQIVILIRNADNGIYPIISMKSIDVFVYDLIVIVFSNIVGFIGAFFILFSIRHSKVNDVKRKSNTKKPSGSPDMKLQEILGSTDKLLSVTYATCKCSINDNNLSYITRYEITKIDTIAFSAYFVMSFIAFYVKNDYQKEVTDRFMNNFIYLIEKDFSGKCYGKGETCDIIFDRFKFYASVLSNSIRKHEDYQTAFQDLIEEFKLIIKTDILRHGEYVPFSAESPLPILGFTEDFECTKEVMEYIDLLMEMVNERMYDLMKIVK